MRQAQRSIQKISNYLFLLLSLYPLLPYHYSSILLILFLLITILGSVTKIKSTFSKASFKKLIFHTGYYIILAISLFYSKNLAHGVDRVIQLTPLFFVPLVLIYFNPEIPTKFKNTFSWLFVAVNTIYIFLLFNYLFLGLSFIQGVPSSLNFVAKLKNIFILGFDKTFWTSSHYIDTTIFYHKAYFSIHILTSLIFIAYTLLTRPFKWYSYILFTIGALFTGVLFYAFSFPNILVLIIFLIGTPLYLIWDKKVKPGLVVYIYYLLLAIFIYNGIVILTKTKNLDIKRGVNFIESLLLNTKIKHNDPRYEIYKASISIAQQNPLLGVGVGDAEIALKNKLTQNLKPAGDKHFNHIQQSENFDESPWFHNNIEVVSKTPNTKSEHDTACIQPVGNNYMSHNIHQVVQLGAQKKPYTFSVFVKPSPNNFLILRLGKLASQRASFNLKTGKTAFVGKEIISAKSIPKSNGWFRFSITTLAKGKTIALIGVSNNPTKYKYKTSGTDCIFIWGAMLDNDIVLNNYSKSAGALLQYAVKENLNTHNNYFYFVIAAGIFCLLFFLLNIYKLIRLAFIKKSFLALAFTVILLINLITENIFSRHFGLMYYSIFLILLYDDFLGRKPAIAKK